MSDYAIAPFWYFDLMKHMECGYGFGVDMNQWIWCYRAKLLTQAENMARDPEFERLMDIHAYQEMAKQATDKGDTPPPRNPYGETKESVRNARLKNRKENDA